MFEELQKKIEEQISFCEENLNHPLPSNWKNRYSGQIDAYRTVLSWL